jgi:hypothetical protein
MKTFAQTAFILSLLLGCFATVLYGDSVDELRDRAKSLQSKAAVLAKQGQKEEASKYEQEAHKLFEAAEHSERERRSPNDQDHPRPDLQQLEQGAQRIKHLRIAAENLRAAGTNDVAEQLTRQADKMELELRQFKQALETKYSQRQDQDQSSTRSLRGEVEDLHRQVEQLRAEVQELRKQLTKE